MSEAPSGQYFAVSRAAGFLAADFFKHRHLLPELITNLAI